MRLGECGVDLDYECHVEQARPSPYESAVFATKGHICCVSLVLCVTVIYCTPQRYNTNGHSKPQKGIPFECITSRRGGSACSIYRVTRPSDYLSYRLNIPQHSRVYYVLRLYVIMAGSVTPFCSLPPSDSDSWSTSTKRNSTPIAAMNFKESSKQDTDECELSTPLTYSPSRFHFRLSSNLRVAKCQC
jgi:hypothetical protein